jgi:hypothetical protein
MSKSHMNSSSKGNIKNVRTVLYSQIAISWDITPYSPAEVYQHFGGMCYLHLYGRGVSQVSSQQAE